MKTKQRIIQLMLPMVLVPFMCVSCAEESLEVKTDIENQFVIKPRVFINDPWTASTRAIGETDPIFMCYLFGSDVNAIYNKGDAISDNMHTTFEEVETTGNYSIYCVTGWYKGEYPRTTEQEVPLGTELSMFAPKDICLGSKKDIYVNASQFVYDVTITVNHIMAKAAFKILNVPTDITDIKVTLPQQADRFKFDGTILGNSQEQTLQLSKNSKPNEDDTYNWSVSETIVYPFASVTDNMPIHIEVTNANGTVIFKTESAVRCNTGKRVSYTTDWSTMKYSQNTSVTINPWTETVEESDLEMGGATKE